MAFPVVDTIVGSLVDAANTATHTVPYPATTIRAGDKLLLLFCNDNGAGQTDSITWPTGWTECAQTFVGAATGNAYGGIAYRDADGTESGSVTVTTAVSERASAYMFRITGAASGPPAISAVAQAATGPADPPALTPPGGAQDYLWIAAVAADVNATVSLASGTAQPANYTGLVAHGGSQGGNTSAGWTAAAFRQWTAATEDPGTFTWTIADDWTAWTLAVAPAPPPQLVVTGGPKSHAVRAQTLSGVWETIGTDRARGIWPEGITAESDQWGPSRLSFTLRRNPLTQWPDIGAFAPIDYEVNGIKRWSGRVSETPSQTSEHSMSVQCEGWQYHLDDDVFDRAYVLADITQWKDWRTAPNNALGSAAGAAAANVAIDAGGIVLTWPANIATPLNAWMGAYIDLGPDPARWCQTLCIDWQSSNNSANNQWRVWASDIPTSATPADILNSGSGLNTGASGTVGYTASNPRRYFMIFVQTTVAYTPSVDYWLKITGARLFRDPTYQSANQSFLKASTVVIDTLEALSAPLLSADESGITATSTILPTYATQGPETPRQIIESVNAYHNWKTQVDADRRLIFAPQPSVAALEVGAWSSMVDEDTSANSSSEVYSRALITANAPSGEQVRASRGYIDSPAAVLAITGDWGGNWTVVSGPAPVFSSGSNGWTWAPTAANNSIQSLYSPPLTDPVRDALFLAGRTYLFQFAPATTTGTLSLYVAFGIGSDAGSNTFTVTTAGAPITVAWSPNFDYAQANVFLRANAAGSLSWSNRNQVYRYASRDIVTTRGFRRTKVVGVSNPLPTDLAAARAIGDAWLAGRGVTPFKGSLTVTGNQSMREVATGRVVPPEALLTRTMDLIRFSDRADPTTGHWGRDGRIVAASYNSESDQASVTIDNSRADFEALMARFGLFSGGG